MNQCDSEGEIYSILWNCHLDLYQEVHIQRTFWFILAFYHNKNTWRKATAVTQWKHTGTMARPYNAGHFCFITTNPDFDFSLQKYMHIGMPCVSLRKHVQIYTEKFKFSSETFSSKFLSLFSYFDVLFSYLSSHSLKLYTVNSKENSTKHDIYQHSTQWENCTIQDTFFGSHIKSGSNSICYFSTG